MDDWSNLRPRAISYVRKDSGLLSEQICTIISGDLLHLHLTFPSGQKLNIINIYNAPGLNQVSSLDQLYAIPSNTFRGNCLIQGDFNLHHLRWQPTWPRGPSQGAEKFTQWTDANNFNLISPI